jgi:hypothetical protein
MKKHPAAVILFLVMSALPLIASVLLVTEGSILLAAASLLSAVLLIFAFLLAMQIVPCPKMWLAWLSAALGCVCLVFLAGSGYVGVVDLNDLELADRLPVSVLSHKRGEVDWDDAEDLWVELKGVTKEEYREFLSRCKEEYGYTIDSSTSSSSYNAYDEEGWELNLWYFSDDKELSISLHKPYDITSISWPTWGVGALLPEPDSNQGYLSWQSNDSFSIYVANMDRYAYSAYVDECIAAGFDQDIYRGTSNFDAENEDGDELSVRYEGNNIISISISRD